MSAPRIAITGLAIVSVVAGVALWISVRQPAAAPPVDAKPEPQTAPKPEAKTTSSDIRLRPATDLQPELEEKTDEEILKEIVDEEHKLTVRLADGVPQEVYKAAAPCYQGQGEKRDTIVPRFRFRYQDGQASLADVAIARSDIDDAQLRGCIVTALENLRWTDEGAEDYDDVMEVELTALGLEKRKRDLLPPDHDDD